MPSHHKTRKQKEKENLKIHQYMEIKLHTPLFFLNKQKTINFSVHQQHQDKQEKDSTKRLTFTLFGRTELQSKFTETTKKVCPCEMKMETQQSKSCGMQQKWS